MPLAVSVVIVQPVLLPPDEAVAELLTNKSVFADGVHCLTCALMLLNTDLHGQVCSSPLHINIHCLN